MILGVCCLYSLNELSAVPFVFSYWARKINNKVKNKNQRATRIFPCPFVCDLTWTVFYMVTVLVCICQPYMQNMNRYHSYMQLALTHRSLLLGSWGGGAGSSIPLSILQMCPPYITLPTRNLNMNGAARVTSAALHSRCPDPATDIHPICSHNKTSANPSHFQMAEKEKWWWVFTSNCLLLDKASAIGLNYITPRTHLSAWTWPAVQEYDSRNMLHFAHYE